jgi:diguanylate cyclase (GGDEF)-like protein/PAS domain S-box-containing protein
VRLTALRDLHRLIGRLNGHADLAGTLQAVVDGVVDGLGFDVAVVNLVHDDGTVQVVSVAGSEEATAALLGQSGTMADWDQALAVADAWGALRFVPHDRFGAEDETLPTWVPDVPVPDDPDGWHPEDALFAPLFSPSGELVGVLSVDLPRDLRRPDPLTCELLEMYAVQAAIAIDNARLTERLRAEQALLRASEASFRVAFENAPVGMSIIDLSEAAAGRFLRVNEAMCRILGYTPGELLERTFSDITHPDHRDDDELAMHRAIEGSRDSYQTEKRYLRADGRSVWVSINTSVVRDTEGVALYAITQFEDVSDRRAAHQELTRRARQDALTGLLNRTALLERVEDAIVTQADADLPGALLFCDLDHFKPVNDSHGHMVGDQVLAIVARRLEGQVRGGDSVGRYGGDEFVVLAPGVTEAELGDLVTRIRSAVSAPIELDGRCIGVTVTVGTVAVTGAEDETARGLIDSADAAMYARKSAHAVRS